MTAPSAVAVDVVARGCGGWGNCRRMMALPTVVVVVVAVIRRCRRCNRSSALFHYQPRQHSNNSGRRCRRSCRRHTRRVVHLVAFCGANRRGGVKSGHHSALFCFYDTLLIQMLPTTTEWRKSESSFSALVTYRVCESIAVNLTTFLQVFLDSSSVDSSSFPPENIHHRCLVTYFLQFLKKH